MVQAAQLIKTEPLVSLPATTLMYTTSTSSSAIGAQQCQPVHTFVNASGGTILATGKNFPSNMSLYLMFKENLPITSFHFIYLLSFIHALICM